MRIISTTPPKSVTKEITCRNCGTTVEYVPNDVRVLWSSRDYSGGPDGAKGFQCPTCNKNIITERW